jgi:hypothetical protein
MFPGVDVGRQTHTVLDAGAARRAVFESVEGWYNPRCRPSAIGRPAIMNGATLARRANPNMNTSN